MNSKQLHRLQQHWQRVPGSHTLWLALLFFVGLEAIAAAPGWLVPLSLVVLLILGSGIALLRYEEKHHFGPRHVILPLFAAIGLTGFSFFLPRGSLAHLYFILAAGIFYWLLKNGARQAYPTWNWVLSTIILFLNVAVALGLAWHLTFAVLLIVGWVSLAVFCITWQALARVASSTRLALLNSLVLAILLGQLTWTLQFLPIHWLVQAGVVTTTYYVTFHLLSVSYERALTRRDFIEYGSIGLMTWIVLLLTARWR